MSPPPERRCRSAAEPDGVLLPSQEAEPQPDDSELYLEAALPCAARLCHKSAGP